MVRVLQSCPLSLSNQLAHLPQHFQNAALHAAFPSILKDAALDIDCTQYCLSTATEALKLLTLDSGGGRQPRSLTIAIPWRLWSERGHTSPVITAFFQALKDVAATELRSVRVSLKGGHLQMLNASDIVAVCFTDVLRSILANGCRLRDADFSCMHAGPAFWDAEMWGSLSHLTSLSDLSLGRHACKSHPDGQHGHSLSILSALNRLQRLSVYILSTEDIVSLAIVLGALPRLQDLRLNGMDYDDIRESLSQEAIRVGGAACSTIASTVTGLTRLEYPGRIPVLSRICPVCVKDDFIWPWLPNLQGLRILDVSSNCSQQNTASRLQPILSQLTALEDLRARVNQYQPLYGILVELSRLDHLTKLVLHLKTEGLHGNPPTKGEGVRLCAALHQLQSLKHLELRSIVHFLDWSLTPPLVELLAECPHNGLSGLTHLSCLGVFPFSSRNQKHGLDFSACQHLRTLELLNCGNRSTSAAVAIMDNLQTLSNLQSLHIDGYASATPRSVLIAISLGSSLSSFCDN